MALPLFLLTLNLLEHGLFPQNYRKQSLMVPGFLAPTLVIVIYPVPI